MNLFSFALSQTVLFVCLYDYLIGGGVYIFMGLRTLLPIAYRPPSPLATWASHDIAGGFIRVNE